MVLGTILARAASAVVPRVEAFVARAAPVVAASATRVAPVVGRAAVSVATTALKYPITSFVAGSVIVEGIKQKDLSVIPNTGKAIGTLSSSIGQAGINLSQGDYKGATKDLASYAKDNPVPASLIATGAVLYAGSKLGPAVLNYLAINKAGEKLTSNYNDQGAIALSLAQQETARTKQALADANNLTAKYKDSLLGNNNGPSPSKTTGADGPVPEKDNSTGNAGAVITPQTGPINAAGRKTISTRKYSKQPIASSTHNFRINIINANQSRITSRRYISGY